MRNQKIIKYGLVLLTLIVMSTFLVTTPVSALVLTGTCPDSFELLGPGDRIPVGYGPGDINGNGYVCVKFVRPIFGGNAIIIDDVVQP